MPKYTTNEFSFDLPEKLHDRSLHIFALSDDGPSDISIVISRTNVPATATLDSQLAALTSELTKHFASFQLIEQGERTLSTNVQAGDLRYSYKQNGVLLRQQQVGMLLPAKQGDGQTWVAITATFSPKASVDWYHAFDAMLASLAVA